MVRLVPKTQETPLNLLHAFTIVTSLLRLKDYYNNIMEYKDRIKELRLAKGLSQMQLAQKLNISQSAIAKWELGKTEPTASALILLSEFFNETTDYILGLED